MKKMTNSRLANNSRLLALALLALACAPLVAQDVTIGVPVTFTGLDDGQNRVPLKLISSPKTTYPAELRPTNTYGCAIAFSPSEGDKTESEAFFAQAAMIRSFVGNATHREIQSACIRSLLEWGEKKVVGVMFVDFKFF